MSAQDTNRLHYVANICKEKDVTLIKIVPAYIQCWMESGWDEPEYNNNVFLQN